MAEAVEFAEALNKREWPSFDWLLGPQEAFLAMRSKDSVSPCRDDAGGGASEE